MIRAKFFGDIDKMIIIRPVKHTDIDRLYNLAKKVGPGMTTFPADKEVLLQKIEASEKAFSLSATKEEANSFLMVLEDTKTNALMGTAGVYSNIGKDVPFYTFQILSRNKHSYKIQNKVSSKTLHLVNEYTGDTEVGTLILDPDYRGGGYGKLLSKCRYLLVAQFRELFSARIVAELRGWSDEDSVSPFWEAVGKHFFGGMQYDHADHLCATTNNQFISDLMPDYPIYVDLLSKDAQSVIGKPHDVGVPALNMLIKEGFRYENYVDIFDGGPTVHANIENIETIRNSKSRVVESLLDENQGEIDCLICSSSLENFRVCKTKITLLDDDSIALSAMAAKSIQVGTGDSVRVYTLNDEYKNRL